ncbi:APC family permease [Hyphomonas adhaerens]|uniref:APC family permease n=1 Tax=Hyphomonas adhaerens TaxID=81029 RepID=UPI0023578AB6|nr:APC family permease [Hyphomonas adhaerens]
MTPETYEKGSLSLAGTVAMGTGVMIGAGIFALTGQVAQFSGPAFPLAFLLAAIISGFSAYTYIKMSDKYPSSGGIAMILQKAYGPTTIAAASALLMTMSMIINESLVARTFGAYSLQLFDVAQKDTLIPVLAVGLIVLAFLVNIAGNQVIGSVSKVAAVLKIGGILFFSGATLWASGFSFEAASTAAENVTSPAGFLAGVALAVLAFKGFTTITNSGAEVRNPGKNVGRAIMWSLTICLVVYMSVAFAVGSSLTLEEIVAAKDFSLAEASRPAFGDLGVGFTVIIAIIATASGLLASVFAVSRMLAMLTDMKLIPQRHFGMPGNIQKHMLVYTVVVAATLAAFFDLGRIASLGAIYYLVMDIIIHFGVLRHLRKSIGARAWTLVAAILFDMTALGAFIFIKAMADPAIVVIAIGSMAAIFAFEAFYLGKVRNKETPDDAGSHVQ